MPPYSPILLLPHPYFNPLPRTVVGRCIPGDLVNMAAQVVDASNRTIDSADISSGEKYLALFLNAQEYGVKIIQDLRTSWHMCIVLVSPHPHPHSTPPPLSVCFTCGLYTPPHHPPLPLLSVCFTCGLYT